jgi:release factor glutamine methyltransferase
LGEAHFRELVLRVDPRVLIPRPETEVLVGEVLGWAARRVATGGVATGGVAGEGLSAVDIGTGSGAIALSLAREGPFARVVATDISAGALAVAEENAERSGLAGRVEFREGELWGALGEGERFDVVVSNPPYIAESERVELEPEVREWEPERALFAGDEGLAFLAALVAGAPAHLLPGGWRALESGAAPGGAGLEWVAGVGAYGSARVIPDLAGRDRVVLAELAGD